MENNIKNIMDHFGKVAVLLGGKAAEREISLKSGQAVLAALKRQNIDAHPIDPDENVLAQLQLGHYDRVFIVLHGRGGEDGQIQGALETIGLPYTGTTVLGSALGMDKYRCKLAWLGQNLSTPEFVLLRNQNDLDKTQKLGLPLIIKPVHEGSSIGITRVETIDLLEPAYQNAAQFDDLVLAERWIQGTEYTCAILNNTALPLIKLETPHAFYDYEAKYRAASTKYHCPCGLESSLEKNLQKLAQDAFATVGARGWGRVDLILDNFNQPYLLEINTVPGMTDHSLVPMAARVAGIDFDQLVLQILATSLNHG